jgi:hypothetical protein
MVVSSRLGQTMREPRNSPIAIVTPSYAYDFERCRFLVESVLRFLPPSVKHYLFVDRTDLAMFACLQSDRTIVAAVEDIIPGTFRHVVGTNTWVSLAEPDPIGGWLMQQIVKLACAKTLAEPVLIMCDSDVALVRDVEPAIFSRPGKTRLYRQPFGITPQMTHHAEWYRNACRLLGVEAERTPTVDYIGNLISWDRALVLRVLDRVESVTGDSWYDGIVHARSFSEYMLYGVYADKVLKDDQRLGADARGLCHSHWGLDAIDESSIESFVDAMQPDDLAVMITARLEMSAEVRRAIVKMAIRRARLQPPVLPVL